MTCFARNLTKLISAQPFFVLIVLLELGITGLTTPPTFACCYDPPEYANTSDEVQSPAGPSDEVDQDSTIIQDISEEAQFSLYSSKSNDQQELSSPATGVETFPLIKRFMADGQYLRARQLAEKQLETRSFDFQLWGLLEIIYGKMGLQNKTRAALKNKELMSPRWRPPPQPAPPMSQQKRYVAKLLQAIGVYKSVQ